MIRRARSADRPALDRLQSHLSRPSPELLDTAMAEVSGVSATPESSAVSTIGVDSVLSVFDVFVAVDDEAGSVVGYLLAVRGDHTHVAEVVVGPDSRRQGHARTLLDRLFATVAERHAGGAPSGTGTDDERDDPHRVRLAVEPDNDAALGLYRSVGFTVARRDDDYFDGAPALLLVKLVGDDTTGHESSAT